MQEILDAILAEQYDAVGALDIPASSACTVTPR